MRKQLLAKSTFNGQDKTVLEHTRDVVECAEHLFGLPDYPTRLGRKFAGMFGVEDVARFLRNLIAAAALHDIGKANEEFQIAIDYANWKPSLFYDQRVRHEHVSAMMLLGDFGSPLRHSRDHDFQVVFAAVVGHHRKTDLAGYIEGDLKTNATHAEFADLVSLIDTRTKLQFRNAAPEFFTEEDVEDLLGDDVTQVLREVESDCSEDPEFASMSRAVTAALIISDTAGSALVRQGMPHDQWIEQIFDQSRVFDHQDVARLVIQPRKKEIRSKNGSGHFSWSQFQRATGDLSERGLLLAPCGAGKTLAAWRWLANQAKTGKRHCIFLYPTRATATEGFRDYVSWAPESDAALMHGSATYELCGMTFNPLDDNDRDRDKRNYLPDQAKALRSLAFWDKRFFSATVDQFLAFLQWDYSSVCLLPVLSDAAVVIDEVHSFDDAMFASLEHFLQEMNVPVLCMTATLPTVRRQALAKHLEVLDAYGEEEFVDLREVDGEPRYRVQSVERGVALDSAIEAFQSEKKVLWVVNTVDRAQALFDELFAAGFTENVHCYHSRFRLEDRKDRHTNVVAAFKSNIKQPAFAVTTQVCEMGLDLDADVLVTEVCPSSSLVQRMGRVNRAMKPRSNAGDVYVYEPEKSLPYDENQLTGVEELLGQITSTEMISQNQLNKILLSVDQAAESPQSKPSFFKGGFILVGHYRDIEEHNKSAVLDSDLNSVLSCLASKEPIDGFVVPVPKFTSAKPSPAKLPRWLSVVADETYCVQTGFRKPRRADEAEIKSDESTSTTEEIMQWIL